MKPNLDWVNQAYDHPLIVQMRDELLPQMLEAEMLMMAAVLIDQAGVVDESLFGSLRSHMEDLG